VIVEESTSNNPEIIRQEVEKRSGIVPEGKYSNWKQKNRFQITDSSGDSILHVGTNGDSILLVPDPNSNGGRFMAPLDSKK
jgi:hypothetical protein